MPAGPLPKDRLFAPPTPVISVSFSDAWLKVARILVARKHPVRNVLVHISDPTAFDAAFHARFEAFCNNRKLLPAKHVAYTIFPHKLHAHHTVGDDLYSAYNRPGGMYDRVQSRKRDWDGYFRRMTAYGPAAVNQLRNVVTAIRARRAVHTAAYQIVIPIPGSETIRALGGPCLNYLAVQLEAKPRRLGLLCVYRNHDFLRKAYGNYWGLTNLVRFLCSETKFAPAPLTCVSSHAYTDKPGMLKQLVQAFDAVSPTTILSA